MKKLLSPLVLICASILTVSAQKGETALGVNVGYGSEIKSLLIGAKFNYVITDRIRLSPSVNYFLNMIIRMLSYYKFWT